MYQKPPLSSSSKKTPSKKVLFGISIALLLFSFCCYTFTQVANLKDEINHLRSETLLPTRVSAQDEIDGKLQELNQKIESMASKIQMLEEDNSRLKKMIGQKPSFADLPVAPNLIKDSYDFKMYPTGKVDGVSKSGGSWSQFYYDFVSGVSVPAGYDSSITASVVDLTSKQAAIDADLYDEKSQRPWGDLDTFLATKFYATSALVLDLENRNSNRWLFVLEEGCYLYSSWTKGQFQTEVSVFVKVLEHEGDLTLNLFGNRGTGVQVDKSLLGKNWTHLHNSKNGFGGCEQSHTQGTGKMKVAIALPYKGYGNHGGVPVWSASLGTYQSDDIL